MAAQIDTAQREIVLVEDAHIRPMMGNQVLESLPSRHIPYRSQAKRGQIAVLGPGGALSVEYAKHGTRFVLMAGKPYGESPIYNGPYVD